MAGGNGMRDSLKSHTYLNAYMSMMIDAAVNATAIYFLFCCRLFSIMMIWKCTVNTFWNKCMPCGLIGGLT